MIDRMGAELEHSIIEAAKIDWAKDKAVAFVSYLELHAKKMCQAEWTYEITVQRSGVWGISVYHVAPEPGLFNDPLGLI